MTCDRCHQKHWLYELHGRYLCSACWDVVATDDALMAGQRKITAKKVKVKE